MKIFLAGATGAVGRLLTPLLVQAGYDVAGTTRSPAKSETITAMGARPVVLDALDREAAFAALRAEQPDVVIHQLTDLATRDYAGNSRLRIEGTRNLVDAAETVGVQRMIAQSISWIYVPGEHPAHEDEPLDLDAPDSRGRTVAAVQSLEQATAEMPVGVVLRYGLLYGPGTWYARDGETTEQIRRGEISATDGVTSFVHVVDAARAAFDALNWPAGVYNIADETPVTGKVWVSFYASLVGAPPPPVKGGRAGWERGATNAKARALGWMPVYPDWREGFKQVLSS
jgi:nucleoside-diphosphate-sugar epimerase